MSRAIYVCGTTTYKRGDPRPDGMMEWWAWAEAQHKSGLRQTYCGPCGKYYYPQEPCPHRETVESAR